MKHSLSASHKLAYRNVSNTRSWLKVNSLGNIKIRCERGADVLPLVILVRAGNKFFNATEIQLDQAWSSLGALLFAKQMVAFAEGKDSISF